MSSMIRQLVNRLFRLEEINGHGGPIHLRRWTLLRSPWGRVYLHHFVGDDAGRDLHDHPKRFTIAPPTRSPGFSRTSLRGRC